MQLDIYPITIRSNDRPCLYPEDNPHEKGSIEWYQWQFGYEDELLEECIDNKRNISLDDVLSSYAVAAPEFNSNILQDFVNEYPEHASALRRYAYIQLSSVPATPEDVAQESVSDEEVMHYLSRKMLRLGE